MGERGPTARPAELKILDGSYRPDRDDNPATGPQFENLDNLIAPAYLDEVATEHWNEIARQLNAQGILKKPDVTALAAYCQAFSLWKRCNQSVEEFGVLIEAGNGTFKANPAAQIGLSAQSTMLKHAQEFGITPSARVRLRDRGVDSKDKTAPRDNKAKKKARLFS